jgi:hypothetical protein
MAFIVSSGRTGTAFFGRFLNHFESVHAVHQPEPDMFDLGLEKVRGKAPERVIREKMLLNRQEQLRLINERRKSYYLESNPYLSLLIPELIAEFPHAKFVFITRDYPSYLLSAYSKSPDRSQKMFMYAPDDHRKRLAPGDLEQVEYSREWDSWERHEKISWYWLNINRIIKNDLGKALSVFHLRYEDILVNESGHVILSRMLAFLGLPEIEPAQFQQFASNKVNGSSLMLVDDHAKLPKLSDLLLDREIQALRQTFGYCDSPVRDLGLGRTVLRQVRKQLGAEREMGSARH